MLGYPACKDQASTRLRNKSLQKPAKKTNSSTLVRGAQRPLLRLRACACQLVIVVSIFFYPSHALSRSPPEWGQHDISPCRHCVPQGKQGKARRKSTEFSSNVNALSLFQSIKQPISNSRANSGEPLSTPPAPPLCSRARVCN